MSEDSKLIDSLKAGDSSAFNELVNAYTKRVINTCYRFLLDKEGAEDVSQEVFVEVYKSIKSFRADSNLSTWIYRIAVTKSLDEIKRRNRKKRISAFGKIIHLDEIMDLLTGGKVPDKILLEKETLQTILTALNKLPDTQRIAFTLSKVDGYTTAEIADIMKTTINSVESFIYRAKKTLATELIDLKKNYNDSTR